MTPPVTDARLETGTTYDVFYVACPPQPSGYITTVEQIRVGECGPVLHGPDAVSQIATVVLGGLLIAMAFLALYELIAAALNQLRESGGK